MRQLAFEFTLITGLLPPGGHVLQVLIRLHGEGDGDMEYLRGYKFEIKSSHSFTVKNNGALRVDVIAWERGDAETPIEQRPDVRYFEYVKSVAVPLQWAPADASPTR